MAREKEIKSYYEEKIDNLIYANKELSSKNNAYAMKVNISTEYFYIYFYFYFVYVRLLLYELNRTTVH